MSTWTIPGYAGDWAVPGYIEERQLGKGASGRVVAAVNAATGKRVAIKYLSSALVGDPAFMWRFRSEAALQRSLDVPHIVRVFDYVEEPGRGAAIVMELVNGVSLHEMIGQQGPASPEAALAVLKGSLLGLAAAHAAGIVHRDYKPENVLVDAQGSSKLADFGVAVQAGKKLPTAGTPLYMAPEQWSGAPSSPATDIYAAAAVFFECLTGQAPFSGRLPHLRRQHETVAVPLDEITAPPLRSLIVRGMAKDPADRPRDAIAFVAELETVATAAYGADWEERGHGHLAVRVAALLPLLFLGGGTAGSTGTSTATSWLGGHKVLHAGRKALRTGHKAAPARHKALAVAVVATAVVVAVAATAAALALTGKKSPTAQLTSNSSVASTTLPAVQAAVTPPVVASHCTAPTSFSYRGMITATAPGPVSYRWVYSSGQQGPVQTVDFAAAGHQQVIGTTVNTMTAGTGWAEIKMLSPDAQTSNRASYKLLCTDSGAGISAAVAIQQASKNVTCGTSPPTFTVTGSITSRKAQTVTYYWALSDGRAAPPATVTFTGPGTLPAETLIFTPLGTPSSGDAVLVVTSPVAASALVPYTLSCNVPLQLAASATVSPANETLNSCVADAPIFTFIGKVSDNQSGTLSYYWKLPSGNGPVQTLNFAQAGTQTVTTTYQPSGDNATGSAAIVVTSPGTASSNAATFTLSCGPTAHILPLTVSADAPAAARVGQDYWGAVTVAGGEGPYTWAAVTGLPDGLTASANGGTLTISGTPVEPGRYTVGVSLSDGESPARTATGSVTIIVRPMPPLRVTADVPAVTVVGDEEYWGTVTVSGGHGPYTWGAVTGLPYGLTAIANGPYLTISGTPAEPGRFLVRVSVSDGESPARTATARIPIFVRHGTVVQPLRITSYVPAVTVVGDEEYSGTVTVSGGVGPYTWAAATGLPDGLTATANGATLTISGSPAKPGRFLVGVSVSDGESPARTATARIPITVRPVVLTPLRITSYVPALTVVGDEEYSGTVTVSGGQGPYTWAAATELPYGLTATANGATLTISGSPTKPGRFLVGVSVSDSESPGRTATARIPITVTPTTPPTTTPPTTTPPTTTPPTTTPPTTPRPTPPPTIITTALYAATWKVAYSDTVTASGGTGAYKWSATGLPSGLTINSATGAITGIPYLAGALGDPVTDSVTVTVTDSGTPAKSATRTFSLTVKPPPLTLVGGTLTAGTSGAAYSATVSATGGAGAYKWSATGLPSGLTIGSATGAITGTAPTVKTATTYTVTVTVADSESPAQTATATFTLTVSPAPTPTVSPPTGSAG